MRLIEPDEMKRYADILHARSYDVADFELNEMDVTDPGSDELQPIQGYVEVRRRSTCCCREYLTGDGTAWVPAFERDLLAGRFA